MNVKGTVIGTDRFLLKPSLICLITVAAVELVCQLPGSVSFFLIPISLLSYGIAVIAIIIGAAYCFIQKRPRRGASLLLMLLLPVLMWRPINRADDLVHLVLTASFGAGELGRPLRSSSADFVAYDWSVGLAGGPNTFLIRDVTDEITLPMARHSHPPRIQNGFEEECAGRVQHLIQHYYLCSF